MKKLSDPQQVILDYMISYADEHSYPPSVREICAAVGLKSTATVHAHLQNLEKKGMITRDSSKQRAILIHSENIPDRAEREEKKYAVPLVGHVAAGMPMLATENIEDAFPLPDVPLPRRFRPLFLPARALLPPCCGNAGISARRRAKLPS